MNGKIVVLIVGVLMVSVVVGLLAIEGFSPAAITTTTKSTSFSPPVLTGHSFSSDMTIAYLTLSGSGTITTIKVQSPYAHYCGYEYMTKSVSDPYPGTVTFNLSTMTQYCWQSGIVYQTGLNYTFTVYINSTLDYRFYIVA